jgi:S-adenosylmethionine hydrolase
VGPVLPHEVVNIPFQKAKFENGKIRGTIAILDIQYGNIWTNIPDDVFNQLNVKTGDSVKVSIYHNNIKNTRARCLVLKHLAVWQKINHCFT